MKPTNTNIINKKNLLHKILKLIVITLTFSTISSTSTSTTIETKCQANNHLLNLNLIQNHKLSRTKYSNKTNTKIAGRDQALYEFTTKLTNSQSGNVGTLKHHLASCPNNAVLSGFSLWGKFGLASNDIAIQFSCVSSKSIANTKETLKSNVQVVKNKKNALNELGNLTVACPNHALLKSFVLKEVGKNIYYEYTCVKAPVGNCATKSTAFKNVRAGFLGPKSISQLDQFKVKASEGFGIQMFRGVSQGDKFKYVYSECKLIGGSNAPAANKNANKKVVVKIAGSRLVKGVLNAGKAIKNVGKSVVESGRKVISNTGKAIKHAGTTVVNNGKRVVVNTGNAIKSAGKLIVNNSKRVIVNTGSTILRSAKRVVNNGKQVLHNTKNAIKNAGKTVIKNGKRVIVKTGAAIHGAAKRLVRTGRQVLINTGNAIKGAGKWVIRGGKRVLINTGNAIKGAGKWVVQNGKRVFVRTANAVEKGAKWVVRGGKRVLMQGGKVISGSISFNGNVYVNSKTNGNFNSNESSKGKTNGNSAENKSTGKGHKNNSGSGKGASNTAASGKQIFGKAESQEISLLGNKFCRSLCEVKINSDPKKCFENGVNKCNKCVSRQKPINNETKAINKLCNDICNQGPKTDVCAFYPFKVTITRKSFDGNLFKRIADKRLLKLVK